MCFVFPGLVCMLWGDNFWNGYWVAGGLRYIIVLHFTWCVNSAAHLYGDHPYDPASWPAENPLVSLGALGEGWHNWHHKYPFDYAGNFCPNPNPPSEVNPNLLSKKTSFQPPNYICIISLTRYLPTHSSLILVPFSE